MVKSLILGLVSVALLQGCSGENTDSTGESGSSDIANLAKVTGPVGSASSSSLAATGMGLADASGFSWTGSHSRPMCESTQMVKDLLTEASQPDVILCYVGVMRRNKLFADNIDNGEYHSYSLNGDDNMGGNGGVKFKIVKNSAGNIVNFEMYTCFGGTSGSPSQDSFISQTNTDGAVTVISKYIGSEGAHNYAGEITATGTYLSNAWQDKTIVANRSFTDGDSTFGMSAQMVQEANQLSLTGYMTGNMVYGGSRQYFANEFYSIMQILNTSALSSFAVGDGSSKYSITWKQDVGDDCGDCNYSTGTGTAWDNQYTHGPASESWNGDNQEPLATHADGTYYTDANGGTPGDSSAGVPSISFGSGQDWDCSGDLTTANFGSAALAAELAECNQKYGLSDRNWVDCSQAR